MKQKFTMILTAILLCGTALADNTESDKKDDQQSRKFRKIDRGIEKMTFINKGQWFVAGTASYMSFNSNDYKFLIMDNLKVDAYSFGFKLLGGYCLANDVGLGLGFDYSRTMVDLPSVNINLGDSQIELQNFYSVQQVYTGTAFLRTYINLGSSRRFGLFNDLKLSVGGGQGKLMDGKGDELKGTYQKIFKAGILIQPGVTVFITDFFAVETSIGLLGLQYSRTEQVTNQVSQGYFESWDANFKINLFSINLGLSFYF